MEEPNDNTYSIEQTKLLKQMLTPVMSLLQDFRELKVRNRLSPDSNISILSLLTSSIKEDIMKELKKLKSSAKNSIYNVEQNTNNKFKDVYSQIDDVQKNLLNFDALTTQINDSISNVRGHLNTFYDKFDAFKSEIDDRALITEVSEIRLQCKQYALKQNLDDLKLEVFDKATKAYVESIDTRLNHLDTCMGNYIDKNHIEEIKTELKIQAEAYVNFNCLLREEFLSFKDQYASFKLKSEDEIKRLTHKIDIANKQLKESINEVATRLSKSPWKREIEKLDHSISLCAKSSELKQHEENTYPLLNNFSVQVKNCVEKIAKFENIVMRYDEILLDKASKDDIKFLKNQLPLYVTINEFKDENNKIEHKFIWIQDKIETQYSNIKILDTSTHNLSLKYDQLKKEQKEVSDFATSIEKLKETTKEKADKIDIHKLIDTMSTKVQFEELLNKIDIMHKQLELGIILNHTLCRTMLNNGEESSNLFIQRKDIYRKLNGLVNWVTGEEHRIKSLVPSRATPVLKNELYLFKEDSFKNLNKTTYNMRNNTARIKIKPKRFTPLF
ncbi:hypothetical protein SteCoe_15471 [Stentor coeruleus]|uniref:Uncharacterized protein n=1 Tax=Stentor coeruleus TaxID=5963 RepID=A0A1R2C3G3_9CILI|nr:hypothetical protein SteCoe_15471 [Stentor coeruleus]